MENLPQIKWHAQELSKLLESYPNDTILADVYNKLHSNILNYSLFERVSVWDKKRQETDQLNANLRKALSKIKAIEEYAESLPDDVRTVILQRIQ